MAALRQFLESGVTQPELEGALSYPGKPLKVARLYGEVVLQG